MEIELISHNWKQWPLSTLEEVSTRMRFPDDKLSRIKHNKIKQLMLD